MMKITGLACLALICAAIFGPARTAFAQTSLNDKLAPYLEKYGLPALAAAVAKGGEIAASGAVGTRRAGADVPVAVSDRFHIGSDTKAMTALLAGMLVDEGKLRFESTPAEVFPELAAGMDPGFAKVTLAQLLSHSAGLPADSEEVGEVWQQAFDVAGNLDAMRLAVVREWGKKALSAPAGTRFEYSNMGYVIAGAMTERAANTTWEELIVSRLFTPLGLATAGLGCQSSPGRVDAPLGHVIKDGKPFALLNGPNADNPSLIGPAGLAHMSITDFARWAAYVAGQGKRGPALVKPETMARLVTQVISIPKKPGEPDPGPGYALGFGVVRVDFAPTPLLQHNGSNTKNLAGIWIDLQNDLCLVTATNIAGEKADEALKTLAKELYLAYAGQKTN